MVPVFYYSNCNGYQNIIKTFYQNLDLKCQ